MCPCKTLVGSFGEVSVVVELSKLINGIGKDRSYTSDEVDTALTCKCIPIRGVNGRVTC